MDYYQVVDLALCTGLGRRDDELHLELRSEDGGKLTRPLRIGDSFAVELHGARRCIGYRGPLSQSLIACPHQITGLGSHQCQSCLVAAQILPCLRCDGERCNNPARRKSCVQPQNHAVYLASFGPGMLKVGVARWERRQARLIEQGARAALIVSRDDGQQVRRTESQIRRFGRVPDRLNVHDKLYGLTQAGTPATLGAEISATFIKLRRQVQATWLEQPESVALPQMPVLGCVPPLVAAAADLRLRGEIEAISGATLILASDSGERVAIDVDGLIGYTLRELEGDEAGLGQLALSV
jgi:hypothetical protein